VKKNLFDPLLKIFMENPNKGNMLHSCFLEIFDYLTKEYSTRLSAHLVPYPLD